MKTTTIEVEKRGKLTPSKKRELLEILKKTGKLLGEYNQLSIFIESENPYTGEIENTRVSIAIAIQKNLLNSKVNCKLKAKVGNMQSKARKEIEIPFEYKDIDQIINFLEIFNITSGCPRFYHRLDFQVDGYFVSVKEKGLAPDHFEVETTVNNVALVAAAEKKMEKWLSRLGLTSFSENEYKEIMLDTFRRYPPVDFEKIDFSEVNRKN